jgi:LysR family carnitine catabolism transcriptional activator
MMNWSTRDLDVFLALAETLSFRRTAERVHLSQPAVTAVINRLEDGLQVRLFDRTTRQVQLTQPGQVFFEQAQRLRHMQHEAVRRVQEVAQLEVGQVAMAVMPSLAAAVIPQVFAQFQAEHPGVQLMLMDTLSDTAFDLVRAGRVDFALTAANPAYADLDYLPLAADGFVLLLPLTHPLANSREPIGWAEVAQLPHVSMPLPSSVRQYADSAFLEHRISFKPQFELEHLASIKALVAAGLGVAALPELAANVGPDDQVVRRALVAPDLRRPIGLVTLRGKSLSPAAQAMVALLQHALQGMAAQTPPV